MDCIKHPVTSSHVAVGFLFYTPNHRCTSSGWKQLVADTLQSSVGWSTFRKKTYIYWTRCIGLHCTAHRHRLAVDQHSSLYLSISLKISLSIEISPMGNNRSGRIKSYPQLQRFNQLFTDMTTSTTYCLSVHLSE